MSTPLLEANAVMDIQDRASAKVDAIAKKFAALVKVAAGANLKTTAFDKLERSMAKVTAGTVNATKSFAALDKGLSSVGRSASAAGAVAGSFDRVARSATTAEVALLRYA